MLLAGGNRLHSLKYDRTAVPFLTDEHPLISAQYNAHSRTILTVTKKSLKVYNNRRRGKEERGGE